MDEPIETEYSDKLYYDLIRRFAKLRDLTSKLPEYDGYSSRPLAICEFYLGQVEKNETLEDARRAQRA